MKKWLFALLTGLLLGLCAAAAQADTPACSHSFVSQNAHSHICTLCGTSLSHEITVAEVQPTCASVGYKMEQCTLCGWGGQQYDLQPEDPAAHHFGEWTVVSQPTCQQVGLQEHTCLLCGETEQELLAKLPHKNVTTVVPPDCRSDGYSLDICSVCGQESDRYAIQPPSAALHRWSEFVQVQAPTCTAEGAQERVCQICGARHRQTLAPTGHRPAVVTVPPVCTEGYTVDKCTVCAQELGKRRDILPPEHSFTPWQEMAAPTCEEPGERSRLCSACGREEREAIPPKGHSLSARTVLPTCAQEGYTEDVCAVCGYASAPYAVTPLDETAHEWDEDRWEREAEPTCTQWGLYWQGCRHCRHMRRVPVQPKGHVSSPITVAPTFAADGYTVDLCSVCGQEDGPRRERQPAGMYSATFSEQQVSDILLPGAESAVLYTAVSDTGETAALLQIRCDQTGLITLPLSDPWFAQNHVSQITLILPGVEITLPLLAEEVRLEMASIVDEGETVLSLLTSLPVDGFPEDVGSYRRGVYSARVEGPVQLPGRCFSLSLSAGRVAVLLASQPLAHS